MTLDQLKRTNATLYRQHRPTQVDMPDFVFLSPPA